MSSDSARSSQSAPTKPAHFYQQANSLVEVFTVSASYKCLVQKTILLLCFCFLYTYASTYLIIFHQTDHQPTKSQNPITAGHDISPNLFTNATVTAAECKPHSSLWEQKQVRIKQNGDQMHRSTLNMILILQYLQVLGSYWSLGSAGFGKILQTSYQVDQNGLLLILLPITAQLPPPHPPSLLLQMAISTLSH